jgi:hypothetical protein
MKGLRIPVVAVSALALCLAGPALQAEQHGNGNSGHGNNNGVPGSITVAFGTGLNNAGPGNTLNHHIIPAEFKVRITKAKKLDANGGTNGEEVIVPATVNFVVSGFHWPYVYNPGVTVTEVFENRQTAASVGVFMNYEKNALGETRLFAKGVNPGTPPAFADANVNPSGVQNRTDSFAFDKPGRYLVVCNVRGHFLDGMYAWVTVVGDDDN